MLHSKETQTMKPNNVFRNSSPTERDDANNSTVKLQNVKPGTTGVSGGNVRESNIANNVEGGMNNTAYNFFSPIHVYWNGDKNGNVKLQSYDLSKDTNYVPKDPRSKQTIPESQTSNDSSIQRRRSSSNIEEISLASRNVISEAVHSLQSSLTEESTDENRKYGIQEESAVGTSLKGMLTEDVDFDLCKPDQAKGEKEELTGSALPYSEGGREAGEYSLKERHNTRNGKMQSNSITDFESALEKIHNLPEGIRSLTLEIIAVLVKLASRHQKSEMKQITDFIRSTLSKVGCGCKPVMSHQPAKGAQRKGYIMFEELREKVESFSDKLQLIIKLNIRRIVSIACYVDTGQLWEVSQYLENLLLDDEEVQIPCVTM